MPRAPCLAVTISPNRYRGAVLREVGEDRPTSRVDDAVVAPDYDLSDLALIDRLSGLCVSDEQGLFLQKVVNRLVDT